MIPGDWTCIKCSCFEGYKMHHLCKNLGILYHQDPPGTYTKISIKCIFKVIKVRRFVLHFIPKFDGQGAIIRQLQDNWEEHFILRIRKLLEILEEHIMILLHTSHTHQTGKCNMLRHDFSIVAHIARQSEEKPNGQGVSMPYDSMSFMVPSQCKLRLSFGWKSL